jgi:CheY-like chemotaxis protein
VGKVLIVDDDPDAIDFVRVVLEEENHEVLSAEDGEEGLATAVLEKPDLIMLDVQMPVMDGFQLFDKLQRNDKTKQIPVVMLTGVAERTGMKFDKESMGEFIGAEPAAYIDKPVDPQTVKTTISNILA